MLQLEESTDYEQRRRLRARIRTLMAEQEGEPIAFFYLVHYLKHAFIYLFILH